MRWAKERAYLAKDKNSVPLPLELEDLEEQMLVLGFNLSLEFSSNGFGVNKSINYSIIRDFCKKYEFDSLELLSLYKQMLGFMEV